MSEDTPLRALILEDNPDDAELIVLELRRTGYAPDVRRVETLDALRAALDEPWDIIYADYQLGGFNALDALDIVRRQRRLELPFIVVSGSIGEDVAVEAMRAGADDYFRKEHVQRLAAATARSLRDAANRRRASEAERRTRALDDRLKAMANAAPIPIAMLEGAAHRYSFRNAAFQRLFGAAESDTPPIGEAGLLSAQDVAELEATRSPVIRAGRRVRVVESTGPPRERTLRVILVPVCDDGERPLEAITVMAVDETHEAELRAVAEAARRQAEAANRMKDEFLLTLSHELRTPLNSILGWTQMLKQDSVPEGRSRHALDVIGRAARDQARLVDDLLELSRIATGTLRMAPQPLEFANVVLDAIEALRPGTEARSIRLECTLEPLGGLVFGDPGRLQQIVWNVVSNAIKFTPEGGLVTVRLNREAPTAVLRVSDSGEGIAPEFLPHVFERFSQRDSSTTRRHRGLGVGLALAKELLEMHAGSIEAESPGVGRGATFTIRLPLRPPDAAVAGNERGRAESSTRLHGDRVLVVEDDIDSRELIADMLETCGAEVRAVGSAREALQTLDGWVPDVLLSDIGLPDQDGYALLRAIRERRPDRGACVPAAAVTAYASADDARRAIAAGYQVHLPKPLDVKRLVGVVEDLAKSSRKP